MSDTESRKLLRKLKAIREPAMRQVVLREFLQSRSADAIVEILVALLAHRSDSTYFAVIDAVTDALGDDRNLNYQRRAELYAAAHASGHSTVMRLLFTRAPESSSRNAAGPPNPETERPVVPRGRELSLGERKALARTPRRELLQHLTREPHPDVIEILLGNPHITEGDVLAIASRRPTTAECISVIARNARWRVRYGIRCALVLNPYAPLHLALRLSVALRNADLRRVCDSPSLEDTLRLQARELLEY